MQKVSKELQTYREQRARLLPKQANDVYFNDTRPNYISISNPSATALYMGLNGNTSPSNYDIVISPYATKQWIKPSGTSMITIFNNDQEEMNVTLQTWEGEFDPSAMSQSTEIVGGGSDGLLGIVTIASMLNELPEGSNVLGGVYISKFGAALPEGNNKIGRVELENVKPFEIKPTPRTSKKVEVSADPVSVKGSKGVVYALRNGVLFDGLTEIWAGDYQSENGISCANTINVKPIGDAPAYIVYE